eukprot:CAMPEP_0194680692 /NCGR_PEP_ID=MMETSP0295-20121207/11604_1 /TAXON_ID=39354 /ORGANISM="Heterosigma akashiwo, Strain CCMP2393" /LENGTH=334 /DNA_ID=CAMNT_0039566465 /DNA_START=8 /DNA_END=1013 /DNA_ORIENTATION=-
MKAIHIQIRCLTLKVWRTAFLASLTAALLLPQARGFCRGSGLTFCTTSLYTSSGAAFRPLCVPKALKHPGSISGPNDESGGENGENIEFDMADLQQQLNVLREQLQRDGPPENRDEMKKATVAEFRVSKKQNKPSTEEKLMQLDEIQERLAAVESQHEVYVLHKQSEELLKSIKEFGFILLYNVGTDNEGIYTLSIGEENIALGWENKLEAQKYAMMLKAQDFFVPTPEMIPTEEMVIFCKDSNCLFEVVPKGSNLTPPEANVPDPEYDPSKVPPPPAWKVAGGGARGDPALFSRQELDSIRSDLGKLFVSTDTTPPNVEGGSSNEGTSRDGGS